VEDVVQSSCLDVVSGRDHDAGLTLSEDSALMKQDLVRDERMHVTSFLLHIASGDRTSSTRADCPPSINEQRPSLET
jgi:hypothetical protein